MRETLGWMMSFGSLAVALVPLLSVACGPADLAGDFSLAVTSGENGCTFDNWTVGDSFTDVPVTFTQNKRDLSASVGGLVGLGMDLSLGSHSFNGTVHGDSLAMMLYGTQSRPHGNCSSTTNANLKATLSGDFLEGEIFYSRATNGNPDCSIYEGCQSKQAFNGSRPPRVN